MCQGRIFNVGFAISAALLLTAIASGVEIYAQHETLGESGFHYISTSSLFRWSALPYAVLNLPAVAVAAVACSILERLFNLSRGTTTLIFLPLVLYLSAYWWKWLAKRFGGNGSKIRVHGA